MVQGHTPAEGDFQHLVDDGSSLVRYCTGFMSSTYSDSWEANIIGDLEQLDLD